MQNLKSISLLLAVLCVIALAACNVVTSTPVAAQSPVPSETQPLPVLSNDTMGGGLLCDNWMAALGADIYEGDQPLGKTQSINTRTGVDTWRCTECHDWDYEGVDGAYRSGSQMTGFKGVSGAASMLEED